MKKNFLTGMIAALGLSLGMTSCGDDPSSGTALVGRISPIIEIDGSIISATCTPASRANEDFPVAVTDLKLKLTSDDGSFAQEWESVNDFDETQDFKVGDYTLEAYYGKEEDNEGYSKPHIYGSQDISVKYDCTTNVALKAEMKNSRVFVRYTDAFKSYMTSYSVQIVTPKGKYINMPGDETSPAYVTPGEVTVNLTFVVNGKSANLEIAKFDAVAKTEHVLTIDIANGETSGDAGADAVLKLLFDDTVDAEDVEIDLSDELFDAPAPAITPEGWENDYVFNLIESSRIKTPVKANIFAQGKIASVMLSTSSSSLTEAGWPSQIDLVTANDADIAKLTELGLNVKGIWKKKNPDVLGVIDFTDVFPNLMVSPGYEESTHTFTIQVKDKVGNLSDKYEFSVRSGKGKVEINWATAVIGRKTIEAEVTYNGTDALSDVKFMKRNLGGRWDELTPSNIQPVAGKDGTYTLTLTAPNPIEKSLAMRAEFGSGDFELDFEVTTPPFKIIASPNDVFAKKALFTVQCDDADDALVARNLKFTLNGKPWDRYKHSDDSPDITLTNLKSGTKYSIEAISNNSSASAEFTTEEELHLPGCGEHEESGEHSVGFAEWYGEKKANYQYLWSTSGWSTLNDLTISEYNEKIGSGIFASGPYHYAYKATSGTIPANGRSTRSHDSTGSDGHTAGNADLHNNKQHTGANAALIRTVGWGKNNTAKASGGTNAGFATCEHMTPGELYLGEYNNGPQYGYNFTSRPSAIKFWYHYDVVKEGNGDYGTAEITVYSSDGKVVATGKKNLTECKAYQEETITLTYGKGAAKAAKLSIIFRSSENPKALTENMDFWMTPGSTNLYGGEYVGSELYIDDVTLIY